MNIKIWKPNKFSDVFDVIVTELPCSYLQEILKEYHCDSLFLFFLNKSVIQRLEKLVLFHKGGGGKVCRICKEN